jgi:spoIIIJ-associated protein
VSAPQQHTTDSAPALPDDDAAGEDALVEDADTGTDGAGGAAGPAAPRGEALLVQEGDVAGDYLERLLDILDVDGDIDLDVEGDRASVAIVGGRLDDLIGSDGATLEALQELTRLAVAQSTGVRSRLMLDVGGFRAKRRTDLTALAGETARRVADSGQPERLSPMNPFGRKVVHDVIAGVTGVHSESEGEEPNRRVVVLPDK